MLVRAIMKNAVDKSVRLFIDDLAHPVLELATGLEVEQWTGNNLGVVAPP